MIIAAGVVSMFFSCSKKSDNGGSSNRKIKYEITGSFSGKLDIVYTDNVNGNTALANVALPWTKEIEYGNNVITIGIGAQGSSAGIAGQTAIIKIYLNGKVVKTSSATVGSLGEILIPAITYSF